MAFEEEKAAALATLEGIELGTMTAEESHDRLVEADPVLVYFVFKWLRKRYRDHDMRAEVMLRLNDIRNSHRSITRKAKSAEDDPVIGWFEGEYEYADLSAEEFIDVVVDKLES